MAHTKMYIFPQILKQYFVLFTMLPRNRGNRHHSIHCNTHKSHTMRAPSDPTDTKAGRTGAIEVSSTVLQVRK